jgi:uncharacterized protein (TIGR03435 family)
MGRAKSMRWWLATAAVLACVAATTGRAQTAADGVTSAKAMAKDAEPDWEVVSIRPSDPNVTNSKFDVQGRHVIIENQTVETMLMVGYGLQKVQIVGAPEWVRTERFYVDGVADVAGQPSTQQFQSMVRKLLGERFGLKARKELRELPVFALRVGKDGPKLAPTTSGPNARPNQQVNGGPGYRMLRFTNFSMPDLALMMLPYVDRPLVDQTALKGRYDFNLKYTYDESRAATDGTAPPGLFTAIQEQMGLKLEPAKAPVDVLVIDNVEHPSAN